MYFKIYLKTKQKQIKLWPMDSAIPPVKTRRQMSTVPAAETTEEEPSQKLSNRGNKLGGEENPGSVRPKMWSNKRSASSEIIKETDDFEVYHCM